MISNRLVGRAGIYLGANVVNASIPFLLLPVLTRVLTPADYGTVAMFTVLVTVATSLTGLSTQSAVGVRYFQFSKDELAEYIGACVAVLVVSTACLLMIVVLLGEWLASLTGVPPAWQLVAVVVAAFQFLLSLRLSIWIAEGSASKYAAVQVGQSMANAGLSLAFLFIAGMAWEGRALGQSLAVAAAAIVALLWLGRDGLIRTPAQWRAPVSDALRFGVPLIPHTLGGMLFVAADRLVINQQLGLAQVGVYMIAVQTGQVLGLTTEAFNKSYAPWLMEQLAQPERMQRGQVVRSTYLYMAGLIVAAVALGAAAPWVLKVVVGRDFQAAGGVIILTALGFAFGGCYFMVANYVFYVGRTAALAGVVAASGVLNVCLLLTLVGPFGIQGAGVAFMVAQLVCFLATWVLAKRCVPMPWGLGLRTRVRSQA